MSANSRPDESLSSDTSRTTANSPNSPKADEFFDYDAASSEPPNSLQGTSIDITEPGTAARQEQRSLGVSYDSNPRVDFSSPGPAVPSNNLIGAASLSSAATANLSLSHRSHSGTMRPSFKRGQKTKISNQDALREPLRGVGTTLKTRKKRPPGNLTSGITYSQDGFVEIAPAVASPSRITASSSNSFGPTGSSLRGPSTFDFSASTETSEPSRIARMGRRGNPLKHWIKEFDEAGKLHFHIAEDGQKLEDKLERVCSHLRELVKDNQPPEIPLNTVVAVQKDAVSLITDVNKRRGHPALDKTGDQLCLRLNGELKNLVSNLNTIASTSGRSLTQEFDYWLTEFEDITKPYIERQIKKFDEMMGHDGK